MLSPANNGIEMAMFSVITNAVIAATCKENGITKIATFDSDFKRLDFLEVIEA